MIELLIKELNDPYIRENFRRIKVLLEDIESRVGDSGSSGDTINNIIAASVWKKVSVNALNSSVTTMDSISINNFKTIKYIVSVRDDVNNKTGTFEINIKNENGSLSDSIFAKISGGINFAVNVENDAGFMKIKFTNNEAVNLAINSAKLIL